MRGKDRLNIGFLHHRLVMVEPSPAIVVDQGEALKPKLLAETPNWLRRRSETASQCAVSTGANPSRLARQAR